MKKWLLIILPLFTLSCESETSKVDSPEKRALEIISEIRELEISKIEDGFLTTGVSHEEFVNFITMLNQEVSKHPVINDSVVHVKKLREVNFLPDFVEGDSIDLIQVNIPFGQTKQSPTAGVDFSLTFLFIEIQKELKTVRIDFSPFRSQGPEFTPQEKIQLTLNDISEIQCMREGGFKYPTEFLNNRIGPNEIETNNLKSKIDSLIYLINSMSFTKIETVFEPIKFQGDPHYNILGFSYLDSTNLYLFNIIEEEGTNEENFTNYIVLFEFRYLNSGYLYYFDKTKELDSLLQSLCSTGINERDGQREYQELEIEYK